MLLPLLVGCLLGISLLLCCACLLGHGAIKFIKCAGKFLSSLLFVTWLSLLPTAWLSLRLFAAWLSLLLFAAWLSLLLLAAWLSLLLTSRLALLIRLTLLIGLLAIGGTIRLTAFLPALRVTLLRSLLAGLLTILICIGWI